MGILSFIIFIPLFGAVAILFIPKEKISTIRWVALGATAIPFILSVYALGQFDPGTMHMESVRIQFVERYSWIPTFQIHYYIGVDGLSFPTVLLTTLLCLPPAVVAPHTRTRAQDFFSWYLIP